ncbi:MAG TPA: superoxide dismutase, partial [Bacteroidales bacterium]|nr:superoxide dismutase [Bacteroidales bacterium]
MDKRTFVKSVLLGVAGVYASGLVVKAVKTRKKWDGIFRLPELPYSPDLLEPFADAETIKLHLQHHAAYTDGLNAAVSSAGLTGKTAHELLRMASEYPADIRNYAGGYINHKLFWRVLTPSGKSPSQEFISLIERDFGSFDAFRKKFSDVAHSLFGSGWIWLIADTSGKLSITSTSNHDNPVMDIAEVRGYPVLCLDLWEHAYSRKNKNRRADHIDSFWNVVNWNVV